MENHTQLSFFPDDNAKDKRPIVGWTRRFWHKSAKKMIYAAPGKAFPIRAKSSKEKR